MEGKTKWFAGIVDFFIKSGFDRNNQILKLTGVERHEPELKGKGLRSPYTNLGNGGRKFKSIPPQDGSRGFDDDGRH